MRDFKRRILGTYYILLFRIHPGELDGYDRVIRTEIRLYFGSQWERGGVSDVVTSRGFIRCDRCQFGRDLIRME